MSPNLLKSIIRAIMPFIESSAVAAVAHFGFHSTPTTVASIVALGGAFLTTVLHALESKFKWFGVFLGWIGAPAYAPSAKALLAQTVATLQAELDALKTPAVVTDLATPPVPTAVSVGTTTATIVPSTTSVTA